MPIDYNTHPRNGKDNAPGVASNRNVIILSPTVSEKIWRRIASTLDSIDAAGKATKKRSKDN